MKASKLTWMGGLGMTMAVLVIPIALVVPREDKGPDRPWDSVPKRVPHTDHSSLLPGPFETGPDVTRACLQCHAEAGQDVLGTVHWTWESEPVEVPWRDEKVAGGKKNVINNFCIGIGGNWPPCTACHAGYGWVDENFDFSQVEQVDCLVCHDQSGAYVKGKGGHVAEGVDLVAVAQSVGSPSRSNCGGCHFRGGGGNAVKHGDLDDTLLFPTARIDVHMGKHDFACIDCHRTEHHEIRGRAISVSVDDANQVQCTDCHVRDLHDDERITLHLDAVACQTCHVPAVALKDGTKTHWDWSTAGEDREEDPHTYMKIKGSFVYEKNLIPEYAWFCGPSERYLLGDPIDPERPTVLNPPCGDISEPTSKIWPFKVHRARQIYDTENLYLLSPKTYGEGGFWKEFDWDQAARLGSEAVNLEYSGSYDFTDTEMYWPQTHMVAAKGKALQCADCHSEGGRMDWQALGYEGDPIRSGGRRSNWLLRSEK